MFTANTDLEIWFHTTTALGTEAHQLAHAVAVENLKRIVFNDLALDVVGQKAARIVAAQSERRLRQVVSAEREEVGVSGDAIRHQCGPRQFDHRADVVVDRHAVFAHHLSGYFVNQIRLLMQLLAQRHERNHDLELDFLAFALHFARSEEHTSELQSLAYLVCRLLLEKKKTPTTQRSRRA